MKTKSEIFYKAQLILLAKKWYKFNTFNDKKKAVSELLGKIYLWEFDDDTDILKCLYTELSEYMTEEKKARYIDFLLGSLNYSDKFNRLLSDISTTSVSLFPFDMRLNYGYCPIVQKWLDKKISDGKK